MLLLHDEVGEKGQQKQFIFKNRTTIQSFYYSFMDSLLANLLRQGKSQTDCPKKCVLNTSCGNKLKLKLPGILRTQEVHIKLKGTEIRHLPLHSTLTSCQNSREYYSKIVTCIVKRSDSLRIL